MNWLKHKIKLFFKKNSKDAIVVFGGGIKEEGGKWRTTNFTEEGDNFGALGDRLRVVAASYLHYDNPQNTIIVFGGRGQMEGTPGVPTISEVIKEELIERNVPSASIITESNSGNTYQQLQELKKIIKKENFNNIFLVSNFYHFPRIEAMAKKDDEFRRLLKNGRLLFQSAEEILLKRKSKWSKVVMSGYGSKAMQERIAMEQKGIKDIKEGKYRF